MQEDKIPEGHPVGKEKTSFWLTLLPLVAIVVILALMMYLGERLENIEHKLDYQMPAMTGEQPVSGQRPGVGIQIVEGQTVYVPVYSHIYAEGGEPFLLETTVSIRNSDPEHGITISSARYFDTKGEAIQEYVEGQLRLGPLETAEFLVKKGDIRGGSGANFIVVWAGDEPVYEPIIEAVMVGRSRNQGISFKSFGRPLLKRRQSRTTP